ncbi:MAG TPA: winged helix-turn-helix domain-containing protein [Pirellulaceae bacterium]|jgi:DNA-binding response OmpR family regulator|nr:winged helix-turn-helix domain-containing protein [Pirellulaceae bacterium]
MLNNQSPETYHATVVDVWRCREQFERPAESFEQTTSAKSRAFRVKMGREPIWLRTIEYRILAFLSAHPYRAYTRRRIAKAVSTLQCPLHEETVDHHIACLRDQLGFFRNYIQSVPYIGYRFKE